MWRLKGKKGYVTYKIPRSGFRIDVAEKTIDMKLERDDDPFVNLNIDGRITTLDLPSGPHTPALAMKALLKIGLSVLQEDEIENFASLRQRIMTIDEKPVGLGDTTLHCYLLSDLLGPRLEPRVGVFRRKIVELGEPPVAEKCIVIAFGRIQLQFFLHFSKQDIALSKSFAGKWKRIRAPLYIDHSTALPNFQYFTLDLSSWEKSSKALFTFNGSIDNKWKGGKSNT
jgi:hypothetical protein